MDLGLKGKIAVVTGASRGIGKAIAKEFLKEGAKVFISGRNASDLENARLVLSEFGEIYARQGDGTNEGDVEALAAFAAEKNGFIDIWVNNVGVNKARKGEFYTESELDFLISAVFKSAVYGTQSAVRRMRDGGSILNISSLAARSATCGRSNIYAAMKSALLAYTRTCAGEYASRKIRVNAILPGYTRTPLVEKFFSKADLERLMEGNLSGRMAEAEEIAKPAVFVSSAAASYINGASLEVSGGQNIVLNPWQSFEK